MSDPFIAEIKIFAGNFAPRGWAYCNGQLMPIAQNTAVFSLVGTIYGGDGRTTFALPNLKGRVPLQAGQGPGLSRYSIGENGGETTVTLTKDQIPSHRHGAQGIGGNDKTTPIGNVWSTLGTTRSPPPLYSGSQNTPMSTTALEETGGGQPHNNMSPYLALTFIFALVGVYPPRS